jgi:hypothetical protein
MLPSLPRVTYVLAQRHASLAETAAASRRSAARGLVAETAAASRRSAARGLERRLAAAECRQEHIHIMQKHTSHPSPAGHLDK